MAIGGALGAGASQIGSGGPVSPVGASGSPRVNQVNQFPAYDPTAGGSDGVNGPITTLRQAAFINAFVGGPSHLVYMGGITQISVHESYDGFDMVPTIGTFRLENRLGVRKFSGSISRYQPRGASLKEILRSCYALPANSDIRMDLLQVSVYISYVQVGANYNYNSPFDTAQWLYAEATFNDLSTAASTSQFVDETMTFMGQAEVFTEGTVKLVTQPQPVGLYASLP